MYAIITCNNTVYRLNCISIQSDYLIEKKEYYVRIETINGFYSFTTERDASYLIKHTYNNSMYFETNNVEIVYKNTPIFEAETEDCVDILKNLPIKKDGVLYPIIIKNSLLEFKDKKVKASVEAVDGHAEVKFEEDKEEETC